MNELGIVQEYTVKARELPAPDVLVAGGGIAGCMAAIAAARAGAQVLLVEACGSVGGVTTFTAGQHICFCGDSAGQGQIFDELVAELEQLDAIVPYQPWRAEDILTFSHEEWDYGIARYFDATVFGLVLGEMVNREPKLDILFHTRVIDVAAQDGRIEDALLHNASGLHLVRPAVVIDCTGDANLCDMAGFPCIAGRESDGMPIPGALFVTLRDIGEPVAPRLPSWGVEYENAEDMPMVALTLSRERRADFRVKVAGHDTTTAAGLTRAELESRRTVLSAVHHLQKHDYPTWKLDSVSPQVGTRIGRRIAGEYMLTADDARRGATFEDGIGRGTCNLSDKSLMDGSTDRQTHAELDVEIVPPYQIPYRSLVPKENKNVLVAGRCMSADSWALSSARMMPACAMMGQAAGIAAAWSAAAGKSVMEVDMGRLQETLRARGARF